MSVVPYVAEAAAQEYASMSKRDRVRYAENLLRSGIRAGSLAARAGRKAVRFAKKGTTQKRGRSRVRRSASTGPSRAASALPRVADTGMPSLGRAPTTAAPIAVSTVMRQSYAPALQTYTLSHREYIGEVKGSVDYAVTTHTINAGRADVFPWLAGIALNFEMYKFRALSFSLKTQSPSIATGTMCLAMDFDPTDAPPADKVSVMQYQGVVRGPPWADCNYTCPNSGLTRLAKYYVAAAPAGETADVRLQDLGNLQVVTQGQSGDSVIAELWCEYTVDLLTPQSANRCMFQTLKVEAPFGGSLSGRVVINESTQGMILSINPTDPTTFVCNVTGNYTIYEYWLLDPPVDPESIQTSTFLINGANVADFGPFALFGPVDDSNRMLHYGRYRLKLGDTFISSSSFTTVASAYVMYIQQYEPTPSTAIMN